LRIARVNRAGETVLGVVGNAQALFEAGDLDERQHRAEDLFLREHCVGRDVGEDGGLKEVSAIGCGGALPPAISSPSFLPASI
jgi:hypothetical protein